MPKFDAEEMMTPSQQELTEERSNQLNWLELSGEGDTSMEDPLEYAKKIESVFENEAVGNFQIGTYLDSKGREVTNLDTRDIQAAKNYILNLKKGGFLTAGSALIKLNKGIGSKLAGSQWVSDEYIGDSITKQPLHTHSKMPDGKAPDLEFKNLIRQRVLQAQAIKRLLDNEQKAGSSQQQIIQEIKEGSDTPAEGGGLSRE